MFVPTEDHGLTPGRELLATPASECPEAKGCLRSRRTQDRRFQWSLPTAGQLKEIEPVDLDDYAEMAAAYQGGS